jgi:hypothetical protein
MATIVLLGIFFGNVSGLALGILLIIAIIFGIVSFSVTRGICL